jgi:DNA-binding SARP family transcriptional activator
VQRARLFDYLDRHASCPLTWVAGPPGSGKTSLVAGYLQRSARTVLWYRADEADVDLATVFRHLREAAMVLAPREATALPALTPEYLLDVGTFARNFLRTLFGFLEPPAALVIDNVHAASDGAVEFVLQTAVRELGADVRLFAISRHAPPPSILGLQVAGTLATLGWDRLRLTPEEATAIATSLKFHDQSFVRTQHALCDGWVAGFLLLLEHARRPGHVGVSPSAYSRTALFSYFSTELLTTAPAATQHLLLCTGLLPSFTAAQAAALVSVDAAEQGIEWLERRNFFIESMAGPVTIHRYHDLFREFLLEQGRVSFSPSQRQALLLRAAQSAEQYGQPDTALRLAIEAEEWAEATRLICLLAPDLIRDGCAVSLERFIGSVASSVLDATPWLLYWQGVARLTADPASGRELLQRAYAAFERDDNPFASLLSCAGIVQSFFLEWGDQHPLDPWLERFSGLWQAPGMRLPPQLESQILPLLVGALLRHCGDPVIERVATRAGELFNQSADPSEQVPLALFLCTYYQMTGRWAAGLPLLARLAQARLATMTPLLELFCCLLHITWHAMCADYASQSDGRREIQRFLDLSTSSGIHILDAYGMALGVYFALNWRDQELAERLLVRMRERVLPSRIVDVAHYEWLCAAVALQRGDVAAALGFAKASLEQGQAGGTRFGESQSRLLLAQIHLMQGDAPEALREVELAIEYARTAKSVTFEHAGVMIKAHVQLRSGRQSEGLEVLRAALALARQTGQSVIAPAAHSEVTSHLCSVAMQQNIEVEHVRKLVRTFDIPPMSSSIPNWPWPIRIYTLGRFTLLKEDTPVRMAGKTQRKPLNVLHALIALGGRSVAIDALIRQVWQQGSAGARSSFEVALVRLRRLLGRADALQMEGGKLTLNERVCWVDSWAFERTVSGAPGNDAGESGAAVNLYRGAFLPAEDELPCVVKLRDRLAAKFQRMVLQVGAQHERAGRFDSAAEVYGRGLEQDNLVEAFHQRLMVCEWKQGHRAQAIKSYRRCRTLLASNLQTEPSPETEALYRRVLAE